ncbi:MAG: FkbM family methyltransferase [Acidimicrobiia bacterium]|nr:FkbM family methyltransferase [Acidimicrobiia bacterium]
MRVLFVVKQKKNVDTFLSTIQCLVDRGHEVRLGIQERDPERDRGIQQRVASPRLQVVVPPVSRTDRWAGTAVVGRGLRDVVRYLRPPFHEAVKLRARAVQKLFSALAYYGGTPDAVLAAALSEAQAGRIDAVLALAESALPTDPLHDDFLRDQAPDLLLVSPVVHFGSAQADLVASARQAGVPVVMLLFSWDNLSTKGALHVAPDWMLVWNERQQREALELCGFPSDRVRVVGAPRFDDFYRLRQVTTRTNFLEPAGLDPDAATVLYVCSSPFVAEQELAVVEQWIASVRSSASPVLRAANLIVRPHPDVALLSKETPADPVRWPDLPDIGGAVARPFADPRAVVLTTPYTVAQAFYECLSHADAVVGLNTSAALESAIAGRPVFTFTADRSRASGQTRTLHFHYLLEGQGGFVVADETVAAHVARLADALEHPQPPDRIHDFAERFLRPLGRGQAVAPLLAETIESLAAEAPPLAGARGTAGRPAVGWAPAPVAAPATGESEIVPVSAAREVRVYRTPETRKRIGPDGYLVAPEACEWLGGHVRQGEIVFVVGAGIGVEALMAAERGATVVAFEPAFATFGRLCANVRLNGCDGSVIPMPLALSDVDGLGELAYRRNRAGESGRYRVRRKTWRGRPPSPDALRIAAPLSRMDTVVKRYRLSRPAHLSVAMPGDCRHVLLGASGVLEGGTLQSAFLVLESHEVEPVTDLLAAAGITDCRAATSDRSGRQTLLACRPVREAAPGVPG